VRRLLLLFCLAACATPVHAGLKTVTRLTFDQHASISTQYVQGRNIRWEESAEFGAGHHSIATIWNADHRSQYSLDLTAKEYVDSQRPDFLLTLATWIRHPPHFRDSGKTVNVYLETVNTGEQREIFGHTARHLITRERRIAEVGACSGNSEVDKDGWYITLSGPTVSYEASLQYIDVHPCRDRVVMHGTKLRKGFLVLETTTEKSPGQFGSSPELWSTSREVIELSEQPLDNNLFQPPRDFKRVDHLPGDRPMSWRERLGFEWQQLEQSVYSWFE
jgi:hypothetical protein